MSDYNHLTTKDLKIATILDTFSYGVFEPEAELFQLTPQNWEEELKKHQPDMLLVESAWRGKDDLWTDVINDCPKELIDIVSYCKRREVPTVFWNKEDPYHFNDFIETAALFNFVFTTDIECIPRYKKHLKHENIFLLPFACQPKIHNPIEKYERKDAFVFAGAYYKRFPERNVQFSRMVDVLADEGKLDIYDRHYGNEKTVFKFPKEYQRFIRGGLSYDEIDKAYKGYKYAINLNSMTESPTMFSRRVFELMASNTIVLSNYTIGTQVLLGDLVISTDDMKELRKKVQHLKQEPLFEKKIRLAALRKVMLEHTAENRLNEIVLKVFSRNIESGLPNIICISYVKEKKQIEKIRKVFLAQSYKNKKMLIVCANGVLPDLSEDDNITFIGENDESRSVESFDNADYLAGLSMHDYYGKNYLMDLVLATHYSDANVISKGGCYVYTGKDGLTLEGNTLPYTSSTSAWLRSSIFKRSKVNNRSIVNFAKAIDMEHSTGEEVFIVDEFNYCRNGSPRLSAHEKMEIDDLPEIDTGVSIDNKWVGKQLLIIEYQIKMKQKLMESSEKQKKVIEKKTSELKKLKTALKALSAIHFSRHPIKKIKSYKQLINIYRKLK